ncbi:MAG: hypothetical protein RMJ49_08265 [Bacteroidia bacterium]|nr:hypothetical protein [Bacteroidia bacterium]
MLLTLFLSVADFGWWSWAGALQLGMLLWANGGVPAALLRYAALREEERLALLGWGLRESLKWGILGVLGLVGVALTLPAPGWWVTLCHAPALLAQLGAEVLRAHLRAQYSNTRLVYGQILGFISGLALVGGGAFFYGLWGAALARLTQPIWQLLPWYALLRAALQAPKQRFPEVQRFGWKALTGNLALEAIFLLPAWLIGWRSNSPVLLAYWRWATLLPLNLRTLFAHLVLYFYPQWTLRGQQPLRHYARLRLYLYLLAGVAAALLGLMGLFWEVFPGPAYLPARSYYGLAVGIGFIWSTDALLLPNLLSAHGAIRHYSTAYAIGLAGALPFYLGAGENLYLHLIGMGTAGLLAALWAGYQLRIRAVS